MKIEISRENEYCKFFSYNDRDFILVDERLDTDFTISKYKNFLIKRWEEDKTLVEILNTVYSDDIFDILSRKLEEGKSVINVISELSDLYMKNSVDYLKFRGDLGEALFLIEFGGKKITDGETYDIELDGKYIEVKSFSNQKKQITISLEQIKENSKVYAVPIEIDQDGLSILDMAEEISNSNPEFAEYIKNSYAKDDELSNRRYKKTIPFDVTEQIDRNIVMPNNVISAEFKISIED